MKRMDARRLSQDAQEDLRRRVVHAVREQGMAFVQAAATFGVSRQSASNWAGQVEADGAASLAARKRGPKSNRWMSRDIEKQIVSAIRSDCPDQLLLPFALWTREAVVELVKQRTRRTISVWTAGRYLKRWCMTPQKPMRRAYEQNPAQAKAWLKERYPAIAARAREQNTLILWGDEMGLRSDDQIGRTYAPRGKTPVVPASGNRFSCNMISAFSNLGQLWFMVFTGRFNAAVFIDFLSRLLRTQDRTFFLIVDSHPAHKAASVMKWINAKSERSARLELFFLPGYSPELNPDECLNQDTKQAMRKVRPRHREEMVKNVRSHLRRRQKQPETVQRFFNEEHVRYAAVDAIVDVK